MRDLTTTETRLGDTLAAPSTTRRKPPRFGRSRVTQQSDESPADALARLRAELAALPAAVEAAERAGDVNGLGELLAAERVLQRQVTDLSAQVERERVGVELEVARRRLSDVGAALVDARNRAHECGLMADLWASQRDREAARVEPLTRLSSEIRQTVTKLEVDYR